LAGAGHTPTWPGGRLKSDATEPPDHGCRRWPRPDQEDRPDLMPTAALIAHRFDLALQVYQDASGRAFADPQGEGRHSAGRPWPRSTASPGRSSPLRDRELAWAQGGGHRRLRARALWGLLADLSVRRWWGGNAPLGKPLGKPSAPKHYVRYFKCLA